MCREMQPQHPHQRVNLAELKAQIVKKLGSEGSSQYFHVLNRFLSSKLTMVEFNKLCLRIVGRENIPLHNQLIRSILKNACSAKSPPQAHTGNESALPNGDTLRRLSGDVPTAAHHRRVSDSSNVKIKTAYHSPMVVSEKALQHHQGLFHQAENDVNFSVRSQVHAPIGIMSSAASSDWIHRSKPSTSSSNRAFSLNSGDLLDTSCLREWMDHIAATQGLQGATMDCAKLLNSSLNSYLKGIITSCTGLGRAREREREREREGRHEAGKNIKQEHEASLKMPNGFKPGYHHVQSIGREGEQERKSLFNVSLREFRVAMELNPQQLGADWPILLERTCTKENEE